MEDMNEKTKTPQTEEIQPTNEYPDFDLLGSNRGRFKSESQKTEENVPTPPKRGDGGDFL